MALIDKLYTELDHWNFNGDEAMFWWRDDDAQQASEALDTMLTIGGKYDVPIALAVVPDGLNSSLAEMLQGRQTVCVLQHGYSHRNHAPAGQKKQELGDHRDIAEISQQIGQGKDALQLQFGDQFIAIMVPPWNRINDAILPVLAAHQFLGLSCYGSRTTPEVADNVWLVNTHVDIVDWKNNKQFIGEERAADLFVNHLMQKREGHADQAEPTGLLTHHLVHDSACSDFLETLFSALDEHPAATWLNAERSFQSKWRQSDAPAETAGYIMPG